MYYDITNPDASYYWLHEVLQLKQGELVEEYVVKCHNDFEMFYDKYRSLIDELDIENMEIVAFQVTTCNDECAEIKRNGLRNLQWVLSNDTSLCRFLKENNICIDIESKLMYIDGIVYDVYYDKYMDLDVISRRKKQLYKIGHKIYYDFQINAFLFCKDIYKYSIIHEAPEFLYTLSLMDDTTKGINTKWKKQCKPFVVKYKSKLKDFAHFTFYENEGEYNEDRQNNWCELRKMLISRAVASTFSDSVSQIYAYMKPDTMIEPKNILEYIPADQWRKDVLRYFK